MNRSAPCILVLYPMRVFLTGGTGFVGGHLLRRLAAAGHSVRALARPPQKPATLGWERMEWVPGDVVEGTGLESGMQGCEAVIHLVGIITEAGRATFERVHVTGTRNVLEAAQQCGVAHYVQMSALGARERGLSQYQETKWKAEELVRQSGLDYCILRPSLIFGPGDGFVSQMLAVMKTASLCRPVPGDGSPRFRPIYIDDLAGCFVQALDKPAALNQTVELGGGDELSFDEVLAEIARFAGIRKPAIHIPMPLMLAGAALAQTILRRPPVT